MKKIDVTIHGMHCNSCVKLIEMNLSDVDGVKKTAISLEGKNAVVEFDESKTSLKEIIKAINLAGEYTASIEKEN